MPFAGKYAVRKRLVGTVLGAAVVLVILGSVGAQGNLPKLEMFFNGNGLAATFTSQPFIDTTNPFFKSIGTNGRACVTCHAPQDAWTVSAADVQRRFDASGGTDPIFRPVDGTVCANADTSTVEARRQAYRLLLSKGLIRIGLSLPENAEFHVVSVNDPYGCAYQDGVISVYRRPLPATNLRFLSAVMWDGREGAPGRSIHDDLISQARDATMGHAQGVAPPDEVLEQIVNFESALYTAQVTDNAAGDLNANGAQGGPQHLSKQPFFLGINDPLGGNPTGAAFDPVAFQIYKPWENLPTNASAREAARASVARGEAIFNSRPIPIRGVAGINDVLHQDTVTGTCTTCHDSPNAGDHSLAVPLNIGISDAARRTPDLPLFTLQCNDGTIVQTSDPGRAMITGKCADIGKVKGPVLRALSSRAPYFHNGSAATLGDAVDFYNQRFGLALTSQEKSDLLAFLRSL